MKAAYFALMVRRVIFAQGDGQVKVCEPTTIAIASFEIQSDLNRVTSVTLG